MYFEPNQVYHVYNRGNNKQRIFFEHKHYLYFLKKVRNELCPHSDVLAYCLMPDHYHLMLHIKEGAEKIMARKIGTLQGSYCRAVQREITIAGSLFQQKAKVKCLLSKKSVVNNYYALICFHYIHQNPLKAGIVEKLEGWEFSSFSEYVGLNEDGFCNKELAFQLLDMEEKDLTEDSYRVLDRSGIKELANYKTHDHDKLECKKV